MTRLDVVFAAAVVTGVAIVLAGLFVPGAHFAAFAGLAVLTGVSLLAIYLDARAEARRW